MFMHWKTQESKHLKFQGTYIQQNPKQIPHMISLDIGKDFWNDTENIWAGWKLEWLWAEFWITRKWIKHIQKQTHSNLSLPPEYNPGGLLTSASLSNTRC